MTIVDGSHVKTDAYRGKGYSPLMVSGAILHSLPSGLLVRPADAELLAAEHALGGRAGGLGVTAGGAETRADRQRAKREPARRRRRRSKPDLTILQTQVFRGPNYWSYEPCIRMLVDLGSLEDWPSNTIPGFNEQLLELLPGVGEHSCSLGKRGGFRERLEDGTWLGHVAEHVALELQRESGAHISRGKTRSAGSRAVSTT